MESPKMKKGWPKFLFANFFSQKSFFFWKYFFIPSSFFFRKLIFFFQFGRKILPALNITDKQQVFILSQKLFSLNPYQSDDIVAGMEMESNFCFELFLTRVFFKTDWIPFYTFRANSFSLLPFLSLHDLLI